jgi:hypothetical protein
MLAVNFTTLDRQPRMRATTMSRSTKDLPISNRR